MSHGKLRHDKNCLNCGHIIEERFCTHCGQENTEPKQPFYFLITHFIEDFTHYDGQFWKTIKYLLFKPGKLSKEYLVGKRQHYVAPVKLYIFMSFITFLWFSFFPPINYNLSEKNSSSENHQVRLFNKRELEEAKRKIDSVNISDKKLTPEQKLTIEKYASTLNDTATINQYSNPLDLSKGLDDNFEVNGYKNQKSYDSALSKNPSSFSFINKPFAHKLFELKEKGVSKGVILKGLIENSFHSLPKALFIYLPIFAFILWIFHNKKKWWYFDHGIFTLHYFSFLLLTILLASIINVINKKLDIAFVSTISGIVFTVITIYSAVYFFIAHHKLYENRKTFTIIKGVILFFINTILLAFLLLGIILSSFMMIH